MNRADELAVMLRVAREAAVIVARIYATNFSVDYKGPADPVTQADREANALICTRLAESFGPVPEPDGRNFDYFRKAVTEVVRLVRREAAHGPDHVPDQRRR